MVHGERDEVGVHPVRPAAGADQRRDQARLRGAAFVRVLIGALAAWALVRAAGLDLFTPLVQLVSYTPYVAAFAVLVLAGAVVLRRWREAVAAALIVVAFGAQVLPRTIAGSTPNGDQLVVMTVNVYHGLADPMALIRRVKPDLVSVQELTPEAVAKLDAAGIARELPYRALRPQLGASGTGLYARFPLTGAGGLHSTTNFDMARATLRTPRHAVDVVSVHTTPPLPGDPVGGWRRDFGLLPTADSGPLRILAGDFNATLDHRTLRRLVGTGYRDAAAAAGAGLAPTWPNGHPLPPVTIDHVLVSDEAAAENVEVYDVPGSDHRALVARLRLPAGPVLRPLTF